jgi:metallo-beta-lactamase family protein
MRIQFCGADRTVTGSSHLLQINGLSIVLDMGVFQGPRAQADEFNRWIDPLAKTADVLILSHGHLDHCGKLPVLTRAGYHGKIYCTPATAEVARVVMMDSAQIAAENVDYLNRHDGTHAPPLPPIYTPADIPNVLKLFQRIPYGQKTDLGKGVSFTFFDAGHILGSAYVVLEWSESGKNRRLLFTADVGRYDTPILRDPAPVPGPMDFVITESTYGNRKHAPMAQVGPQFLDALKYCIVRKSRLLIPSFAVGRTQTVLWYIQRFIQQKLIPEIPIFVDSPMGIEITKIHSQFRENYDQETLDAIGSQDLFGTSRVTFAGTSAQSKQINSQAGPCVIIASSPTCEFGRILYHLVHSAGNPNDLVTFVGYIPPGTLGRRLQQGQTHVRILDQWHDVRFQVRTIDGLSAHADGDELIRFLTPTLQANCIAWVVHGEADSADFFANRLKTSGIGRATAPPLHATDDE